MIDPLTLKSSISRSPFLFSSFTSAHSFFKLCPPAEPLSNYLPFNVTSTIPLLLWAIFLFLSISLAVQNNEEGIPYSQRKRFGRAEMAKVLMERNNYKERFMELQDAIRYSELVRANKVEKEKQSGLWKLLVYVLD